VDTKPASPECARIYAHSGLRTLCNGHKSPFRRLQLKIEFVDQPELSALIDPTEPILVPATNQLQAEFLRFLRQRFYITCIIAVVNDVNGHQTFQAMAAGATCIFNVALSVDRQIDTLSAVLNAYSGTVERPLHLVATGLSNPEGPIEQAPCIDHDRRLLVSLLCGSHTISSIAKRYYCSERSMYRRVREIYDFFGVAGRNELRSAIAVSHVETRHVS